MDTTSLGSKTESVLLGLGSFLSQVYAWMSAALLISGAIAFYLYTEPGLVTLLADVFWIIFLVEILIVITLAGALLRLHIAIGITLFLIYSVLNGLFLGVVLYQYDPASIFTTFGATAGTFLLMSVYGLLAKQDLTRFGQLAVMGLIGLIVGAIINIFLQSSGFSWFLTYLGIGVFIVLIAWESQKMKRYAELADQKGTGRSKFAIYAAFDLYLSFINLFILLLRIFGRRR